MHGVENTAQRRLQLAVQRVFAGRPELASVPWGGTLGQVWDVLTRVLVLDADALGAALAPAYGVEAMGRLADKPDLAVVAALPAAFCQRCNVLPIGEQGRTLVVASADPGDAEVVERAAFLAGRPLAWRLGAPALIEDARVVAYSALAARVEAKEAGVPAAEGETYRLGQALLESAVEQRASDLHVQPHLGAFIVRARVDGELRRLRMLEEAVGIMLIRHIKARSGMDPTNHLVPQDGRMSRVLGGRDFELRVSSLPASRGERLVIRFLDQGRVHRLAQAGFSLAALQALRRTLARPSGLVVMTGPTGCGKTSTLYGMLAEVNRPEVSIITVENPVEYRLPGASQVEVNERAGLDFHAALRSILRQDPDVVLVGEIRDAETAKIATQAALTGHLVLSTLHTNDAVTAIPRLLNLGVDPSILADSLAAVAAQRLCRILCVHCRVPVTDPLTPPERHYAELTRNRPLYRPAGCPRCDFMGFRGRLPVVDILEMNEPIRDAVARGETRLGVLEGLRSGDLRSLAASGSHRILSGDTTVTEVMAAVGPAFWTELAKHHGAEAPEGAFEAMGHEPAEGLGMLLVTEDPALVEKMSAAAQELGLRIETCDSASAAEQLLRRDQALAFIIGDVPERFGLDETSAALREYRIRVAWSRLPTLVLLPAALAGETRTLRERGAMADFLAKPLDLDAIVQHIRRAHAR